MNELIDFLLLIFRLQSKNYKIKLKFHYRFFNTINKVIYL